jgi:hypothetical protein
MKPTQKYGLGKSQPGWEDLGDMVDEVLNSEPIRSVIKIEGQKKPAKNKPKSSNPLCFDWVFLPEIDG